MRGENNPFSLHENGLRAVRWSTACLFAVILLTTARLASAEITIPETRDIVVDTAGVINAADRQKIAAWLEELRQKTTAEVKVLTVKNTDGEDIFSFAQRQYDAWKLGLKGKDNGALIVLDVEGHHARIHTGRGLEGMMPDSWCGTALRQARDEFFKPGRYSEGMAYLATVVANRVADDAGVKLTGVPDRRLRQQPQQDPNIALLLVIIFAIIVIVTLINARRGRRPGMWNSYGGPFFGGFGGGSFGGGSFGGGSFGGGSFGGDSGGGFTGGGGFSGGGGASTSW